MIDYIRQGGIVMIPIMISSIIALTLVIEKLIGLICYQKPNPALFQSLFVLVRNQEWDQALVHCKRLKHPVSSILAAGLVEISQSHTDLRAVEESMKLRGDELIRKLESSVRYLGAIVTILPMLGFLGTIVGLIASFQRWEVLGANVTISDLSGGIYQAMITTAAGLILAIPYYFIHSYLVVRIEQIELELSKLSTDFLSQIRHSIFQSDLGEPSKLEKIRHSREKTVTL